MWSDECQIKGSLPSACCLINTVSMLFAISVARVHSWLTFSSISAGHLRPFPAELLHRQSVPGMYFFKVYFLSICRTLHLSLNFMRFLSATINLFFRRFTKKSSNSMQHKNTQFKVTSVIRQCSFELFDYIYTKEAFLKILLSRPLYTAPLLSSQYLQTPSAL